MQLEAHDPRTDAHSEARSARSSSSATSRRRRPGRIGVAFSRARRTDATVSRPGARDRTAAAGQRGDAGAPPLVDQAAPTIRRSSHGRRSRCPSPTPDAPAAPEPLRSPPTRRARSAAPWRCAPGTWDLTLTAEDQEPVTRRVIVGLGDGLGGHAARQRGSSYLEIDEDGQPVDGVSGSIAEDGDARRAGGRRDAAHPRRQCRRRADLLINGIDLGAMGDDGAVVEWRITAHGKIGKRRRVAWPIPRSTW